MKVSLNKSILFKKLTKGMNETSTVIYNFGYIKVPTIQILAYQPKHIKGAKFTESLNRKLALSACCSHKCWSHSRVS